MRLKPTGLRELLIWLAVCWLGGMALFTVYFYQFGGFIG
jgi:hypothetical protein